MLGVSRSVAQAYSYAKRRGDRLSKCAWRDGEDIAQQYMVRVLERGLEDMGVRFLMNDARLQSAAMSRLKAMDGYGEQVLEWHAVSDDREDFLAIEKCRSVASKMGDKYERLFDLLYGEVMTNQEAADAMGVSKSWVDKASIRMKKAMREAILD